MFVPSNGASKSFLSSSVKLTLNEATSLNSRELLQIPFTEFLQILKRNLWAEINAMSSSKERSRDQVKKRTEENWFKMNSKWHDLLNVLFFLRITMNKAFFPCKPLCLRAVNLPTERARGKTWLSGNCLRQEVRPLDLSKFAGNASVSTARGQNNLWLSLITTTHSTSCWLSNGDSNSCGPIRSVIIRVITKSDFSQCPCSLRNWSTRSKMAEDLSRLGQGKQYISSS